MNKLRLLLLGFTLLAISCQAMAASPPALVPTIALNISETTNNPDNLNASEPTMVVTLLPSATLSPTNIVSPTRTAVPTLEPTSAPSATPTSAMSATLTLTPTATIEPTATYWPTVTRQALTGAESAGLVPCQSRVVGTELLAFVTQQFSLPEFYVPADLTPLSDYFDSSVTLNQDLYLRQIVIDSLKHLLSEMNAAGLYPSIISAYRSYGEQSLAWKWWESQYPGRVAIMSARPGYSEHQLGTTVDFGSPALDNLFHVDFANTPEGVWLTNNAHRFGFTLSYPDNSYYITGFKYEPWHFRYVGTTMATELFNSGQILTSWQLENLPPPCIPWP